MELALRTPGTHCLAAARRRRFENYAEKRISALHHATLNILVKDTDLASERSFGGSFVELVHRCVPVLRCCWPSRVRASGAAVGGRGCGVQRIV